MNVIRLTQTSLTTGKIREILFPRVPCYVWIDKATGRTGLKLSDQEEPTWVDQSLREVEDLLNSYPVRSHSPERVLS